VAVVVTIRRSGHGVKVHPLCDHQRMTKRGSGPDFVEALARGLDVLTSLGTASPPMSLRDVADDAGLARPTARRLLLTLMELGYVRAEPGGFALTPRVLDLGMAYVGSLGIWEVARPHMQTLVGQTGESSSMAQLDGGDIVYVARVAVPKIITLRVEIGTRFPALVTSQGKVLLAALGPEALAATLREPSRSGLPPLLPRDPASVSADLEAVRARGWALADEELAPGIRSVAVPVRDGAGQVRAAMNVTVHAAETTVETLVEEYLPKLLRAAGDISADWARRDACPHVEVTRLAAQA
jgi:IclR family transcriptional regulator, pca regulon regulatory protein